MGRPGQHKKSSREHARLEPRVVHVSEANIRKKWKKLPLTSHANARELILSVQQQSRNRRGKGAIDQAIEQSVQAVAKNLTDKLARIPYPPSTDEQHFDHEANVHRIGRIEEQLNSNKHSISLLSAQLAKEEEHLRQDKAEVNILEQNQKSGEAVRRLQRKTLHPVAQGLRVDHHDPLISSGQEDGSLTSLACLFQDEDMLAVLDQLQSHLGSMHNNISAIREIKQAVQHASFDLSFSVLSHGGKHSIT